MKYTIRDILDSMPPEKYKLEPKITRLYRFISYSFVWIAVNCGISANSISVISIMVAMAGSTFLSFNDPVDRLIGVILLNFWVVCDTADGEIARTTKTTSYMGEYFDAIGGYAIFAFAPLSISVAAYHTSTLLGENNYVFIIIGSLSAITGLYARLIHQKFIHAVNNTLVKFGKPIVTTVASQYYEKPKKDLNYYRKQIDLLVGTAGYYCPLMVVALVTNHFDYLCIAYSVYFICGFFAILLLYLRKAACFSIKDF